MKGSSLYSSSCIPVWICSVFSSPTVLFNNAFRKPLRRKPWLVCSELQNCRASFKLCLFLLESAASRCANSTANSCTTLASTPLRSSEAVAVSRLINNIAAFCLPVNAFFVSRSRLSEVRNGRIPALYLVRRNFLLEI